MPKNATVGGDGFRMYPWPGGDTALNRKWGATEPSDLLSVTSIRTLSGEPFQLVNWKITNVVNLATGTRQVVRIGPRGGVNKKWVKDGEFPGEFVRRMIESDGNNLDDMRRWVRNQADEPRDIAAVRGSVVHKMIEDNLPLRVIDEEVIRKAFARQWAEEKRKVKPDVLDDDVNFVANGMANYWNMRQTIPFVILAQEPQIYNLTAGYGGSADVLIWFLGHWERRNEGTDEEEVVFVPLPGIGLADIVKWQKEATAGRVTLAIVEEVGGTLAVGDWKTSAGVYTNHVVQTTAYMAGEFIADDYIIDERLSDLLVAAMYGMVIHIRPDHWSVDLFELRKDVLRAFFGSVAFSRFIAMHKTPQSLFIYSMRGQAEDIDELEVVADGE